MASRCGKSDESSSLPRHCPVFERVQCSQERPSRLDKRAKWADQPAEQAKSGTLHQPAENAIQNYRLRPSALQRLGQSRVRNRKESIRNAANVSRPSRSQKSGTVRGRERNLFIQRVYGKCAQKSSRRKFPLWKRSFFKGEEPIPNPTESTEFGT